MVHAVEDVLVHGLDLEGILSAQGGHAVDEFGEGDGDLRDVGDHDHGEVAVEDGLRNVADVDAARGAFGADFGDDADGILADDGYNGFHGPANSPVLC